MRSPRPPRIGHPTESGRIAGLLLAAVLLLAFGVRLWMALTLPRYFDDHYVLNNVETFLNGSLRPRHSFYGSLSFLPQALFLAACDTLHRATGIDALAVRGAEVEGFTLGAFRVMRMFIVAYALLSILVIDRIGRRLFSPWVGLAAAAVLAAYPQHLRSSVQLKPDMLALLLTVVTLYWTVRAAQDPRLSRFVLAGVGVGLATSAKYIGLASALPLTLWALASGFRDRHNARDVRNRRRWGWLVLAGAASVATFFALNPFVGMVFRFASTIRQGYASKAESEGSGHWVVLRRETEFLAVQHGWLLGILLLLGAGLLIHRLWRQRGNEEATPALLALSLCVGYPLLHAAGMTLFRTHNLLPAMAGTALTCAYGMIRCGEQLPRRRAAVLVWLLPAGVLLVRPFLDAYTRVVPNTWAGADKTLVARLSPLQGRQVAYEPAGGKLDLSEGPKAAAQTQARSLAALRPARLDLMDAEVFPLSRTEGPEAAFYQGRRQRLARECVEEISPRLFHHRGAPLLLLLHPWASAGHPVPLDLQRAAGPRGDLIARLPAGFATDEVLSIELVRPAKTGMPPVLLQPTNQSLPIQFAGRTRWKIRFTTPRFRAPAGLAEIHVPAPADADPKRFQLKLWRWSPAPCS